MKFNEKLKKVMQERHITQAQLVGMTGIGKSSISQYLSGVNVPSEKRRKQIAVSLGLPQEYFEQSKKAVSHVSETVPHIPRLLVTDAARLLGMNHTTVRKGLQQGIFPWGYAIQTSKDRWTYFINARRFFEIEGVIDESCARTGHIEDPKKRDGKEDGKLQIPG